MNLLQLVQCTTYVCISIIPATGGQEESGAFAGIAAGVAVVLVLAVVVVVVVMVVAIFLVAMCSTQQKRKRSGRTCHVPADTLLATDDSASTAMTLIINQAVVTYDEVKEDTSGGDEAGCVQYDYARPTDVVRGVMGLEPSAHDAALLTPMYALMSNAPCAPAKASQIMQLYLLHNIANHVGILYNSLHCCTAHVVYVVMHKVHNLALSLIIGCIRGLINSVD